MIRRLLFLFAFICIISNVYSVTTIGALPYNITSPGEYNISGNLSSTGHGITFTTQNASLNCEGYTMRGDSGVNDYGIYVNAEAYDNNNISNCNLLNFGSGIYHNVGDNSSFKNISIINISGSWNIYVSLGSNYNTFDNITINTSSTKYSYYSSYCEYNTINNSNLGDGYVVFVASDNSKIQNSYFTHNNSYITISRPSDVNDCLVDLINVTKPDGKYIYNFHSNSVNIDGWTNISQLTLCNAYNSTIQNLNLVGNRAYPGITAIELTNVTFLNLNISNYTTGISAAYSSNNNLTNINSYLNSQDGISFVTSSSSNNFNNINAYNNSARGIYFATSSNNNLTNINSSFNTQYGIQKDSSTNNKILDSTIYDSGYIDISITGTLDTYCNHIFTNITDNYGMYHHYFNQSVNIDGWTNISSIILCNADNSIVKNLNYDGLNDKGTFIITLRTDYSNFSNLNITNYYYGIYLNTNSNYNNLNNLNTSSSTYGISLSTCSNNTLTNFNSYNHSARGFYIAFGGNNNISNFTTYNSLIGVGLGSSTYNNFTNFSTYKNSQFGIDNQANDNYFENFNSYNNSLHGFSTAGQRNRFNNFSTYYNAQYGVYLSGGSNNNLSNFNSFNNTQYGIFLSGASNNNLSDFSYSGNILRGINLASSSNNNLANFTSNNNNINIYLSSSSNNNLTNFTSYNNTDGIYIIGSLNNIFQNIFSNNTAGYGIYFSGISNNNSIINSSIYSLNQGLYFSQEADRNIILNSTIISTNSYNLYFSELGASKPENNTFYNNYLGNISKIYSNNWTNINYFNYTIPGVGNIGNYWNDFGVCSVKTVVGTYGVCANPANYTLNSTNNIYDFAPLYNPYEIDSCTNLTIAGGNYYMTASILNSATSYCINISSNNITFDCRGFTIDGNDVAQRGIQLYRSSVETTNVTIKNCIVSDFAGYNMYIFRSNLNVIQNLTINSSPGYGINLDGSDNILNNITINNNNQHGLFMSAASRNNLSAINILNNAQVGLYIQASTNNSIYNSTINNNTNQDIYVYASSNSYCNHLISNVSDNYGKYHLYSNQSVNIDSWTNLSSIILCNADNSIVKNLNYNSSNNLKGKFLYLMRTDTSNLSNLNIGKYYSGIYLDSSSNNNLYNFTNFNNFDDGLFLTSSNSNNMSNFTIYGNSQTGVSVWSSSNNQISNFNVYLNSQAGIEVYGGTGSFFSNFNSYNNTGKGIYLWSAANNNVFSNFTNYYNSQEGIHLGLGGGAKNNTFYNATLTPNTGYNIYFEYTAANYPVNNTFYNSILGNSSKIASNFAYNSTIGYNYFNSSLSGYNIGNYWNNFGVCSSYETRGSYKVCLNPANYTINAGNNTYDFAPLIIMPEYISPTPANNSNLGTNTLTIKVEDTQRVSTWFNVTINGVSYAMTNTSSTNYEYTLTDGFNEITEVTFNVSYAGSGIMETRTFTYYPDYTQSVLSSYGFASFFISIISIVFLFFNLNFRKNNNTNNNKKGITEVIAIISLLLVAVTAAVFVNSWYQDFSVSYQTKKLGSTATSASSFEVMAIQNESNVISVYLKSKSQGYSIIERISVNSVDCTIVQDNVILGSSITPIEIECSAVDSVNNYIVVYSKKAIFSANKPLTSICSLSGVQINSYNTYTFYNSSSVSYGSSCYNQTRTCTNGVLDGDSSYIYSNCYSLPPLNCSSLGLAGGTWITVPGNSALGTSDFCVMKFEVKNVSNIATSQASLTPWVSINQSNARNNCNALGTGYHLITNAHWTTIARNAEQVSSNWNTSIVGNGFMFSGHNDNNPSNAIAADINDSNGYYLTADNLSSCDGAWINFPGASDDVITGRACAGQKRTLILSNGEVIWDLSGNHWEWNNDTCDQGDPWYSGAGWVEWTNLNVNTSEKTLGGPLGNYDATNGVGRYYGCTTAQNGFLRGGYYGNGEIAGPFFMHLFYAPSSFGSTSGFRCIYTP